MVVEHVAVDVEEVTRNLDEGLQFGDAVLGDVALAGQF